MTINVKNKTYYEQDLHLLFSTYLESKNIYCKTIPNEYEENQKWIQPDIVGINFLNFKRYEIKEFIEILNISDTFSISSYKLTREIKSDSELREYYFQAVSNSSWANYGYLVAFEINSNLLTEIEKLNQTFGIGIIELKANPYESKILFPSRYRDLDFKTIDNIYNINDIFEEFIFSIKSILKSKKRAHVILKKLFQFDFCNDFLKNDTEIISYCKSKNIPMK